MRQYKQHVLIVEDDPVTMGLISAYFEKAGFRVFEAINAGEVWPILKKNDVDLAILDINLPGEDGFSILHKLREQSSMGIIMATSRADDKARIFCLKNGADDYITKPFNEEEVLLRAQNLIKRMVNSNTQRGNFTQEQDFLSKVNAELDSTRKQNTKLIEQQASLIRAQKISNIGSWDWNINDNSLLWSDEIYRIFGLTPQHFKSTYDAFLDLVHPNDRDRVSEAVKNALDDKAYTYQIEHRIVQPSGKELFVQERGEVFRDIHGCPIRMVGTIMDITERKEKEDCETRSISSRIAISALLETGLEPRLICSDIFL
jgi:PAS domain S-box-containing protein